MNPEPFRVFAADDLEELVRPKREGRIREAKGMALRVDLPEARIGELCRVRISSSRTVPAEVVGFDDEGVVLMPLHRVEGLAVDSGVEPLGRSASVLAGPATLGRVLDALGEPIDGKGPLGRGSESPLLAEAPHALTRQRIAEPLHTGVRALDGLLLTGRGQRVGIFARAGAGKSTLLGALARNAAADRVVLALIGERGREVRPFLEDNLGPRGMEKATVVVSTSEEPPLRRLRAAYVATAIAEEARARGEHVLLLVDSVTRFARALRDVGLAADEPPGRQGYPVSVYAQLPRLFERAGTAARGSITAFYTVLVTGDVDSDAIGEEVKSLLDGHVVLDQAVGYRPAIDVVASESRVMGEVLAAAADRVQAGRHERAAAAVRACLLFHHLNRDKIQLDLLKPTQERQREYLRRHPRVLEFLSQDLRTPAPPTDTVAALLDLARGME